MKFKPKKNIIIISTLILTLFTSCDDQEVTTFYLVRHAEKEMNDSTEKQNNDPKLTIEGKQRAQKLADLLQEEKISAIYATVYQRNMKTVAPLARSKDLSINNYEWYEWQPMIDSIKQEYTSKSVLICGHGDNLLPMIDYLNGKRPQEKLAKREYDKIFKIMYEPDTTIVTTLTY